MKDRMNIYEDLPIIRGLLGLVAVTFIVAVTVIVWHERRHEVVADLGVRVVQRWEVVDGRSEK